MLVKRCYNFHAVDSSYLPPLNKILKTILLKTNLYNAFNFTHKGEGKINQNCQFNNDTGNENCFLFKGIYRITTCCKDWIFKNSLILPIKPEKRNQNAIIKCTW